MNKEIVNPLTSKMAEQQLESESSNSAKLVSESLDYSSSEACPKCSGSMEHARIIADEPVRWCPTCRVSTPIEE